MSRKIKYTLDEFATLEHELRKICEEYHVAKADAEVIKEMSKDVLAQVMSRLDTGEKVSSTELERLARCDKEWKGFREGQKASIMKEAQKKAAYIVRKTAWDTVQSGLSYKKVELSKL